MDKLTEKQQTVLHFLARRNNEVDGPMTGAEIGEAVFRGNRTKTGVREWAGPALRAMEARGLVEKLGLSFDCARCWRITDAGRSALASQKKGDGRGS